VLSIRGLSKSFTGPRPRAVLAGIDLELAAGEYVAVRGESGIGKSTLLNLIAGLDQPDAGSIALDGIELTRVDDDALTALRRERMGFVFQAFHLLPYLTAAQNVALPLLLNGTLDGATSPRVGEMLAAVGLSSGVWRPARAVRTTAAAVAVLALSLWYALATRPPHLLIVTLLVGSVPAALGYRVLARKLTREGPRPRASAV